MKFPSSFLLMLSLLAVVACTPSPEEAKPGEAESRIPTQAEMDRLLADGAEPSLREIAKLDYWLHYKLMKATGIEKEFGGETQALSALQALGDAYEKQLRGPQGQIPRMVPVSFTGEGMDSGLMGASLAMVPAMMTSLGATSALSNWSAADLDKAIASGVMPLSDKDAPPGGGSATRQYTKTDVTTVVEMEVEAAGLKGKTRSKVRIDSCPDASGTITADIHIDSSMQVAGKSGTGGGVSTRMHLVRHLDDDARLMAGEDKDYSRSTEMRIGGREGGDDGRMLDLTLDMAKGDHINDTRGIGLFESEEAAQVVGYARQVESTMAMIVEAMLTGVDGVLGKPAWESGHCVDLKVSSDPAKRKGAKPNTTYSLLAEPRAKADGAPTGGTVRATLTGKSSLTPDNSPVKADATFTYSNPTEKNQSASISFEARSKRGVGRATLEFDTKEGKSYRITGIGDCPGPWDVCDTTKPFTFPVCGGVMTHTPKSDAGGSQTFSHSGAHGSGSYSFSGPEEKMTVTYRTTTCAMGKCYGPLVGTAIWTKIDSCE